MADSELTDSNEHTGGEPKQKCTRTGPISQDEIAIEASCLVYKIITSVLHRSRVATKIELFQSMLYLFTGWAQYEAPVKQDTLKMEWDEISWPSTSSIMESLPKTYTLKGISIGLVNVIDAQQVDLENMKLLEQVIGEHPELTLLVEHDVVVEGKPRLLRYRLSMIEVGSKFFASFISCDSNGKAKDALTQDKNAFTLIILIAIGLRRLVEKAVHDTKEKAGILWANNTMSKGKRGRPKKRSMTDSTPFADQA